MNAQQQQIIRERYKLIREIARGGMGVVYLAKDLLTNGGVALKTSSCANEQKTREAFETEAKLLARLDHPGLPKVRDYFLLEGDFQALVMDFVEGETLAELLDSGKSRAGIALEPNSVIGWSFQILDILSYLHGFTPPVIHRDIKPNNLKLKPDGTIVLLDFGLAKGTMLSVVSGGSGYSSLEQLNFAATDARSDIYSFGATVYHLLTNQPPLNAMSRFQAAWGGKFADRDGAAPDKTAVQTDPQIPIAELNPRVSPEISAIFMKAMAVFPEDRFQTAAEMKTALRAAIQNTENFSADFGTDIFNTKSDFHARNDLSETKALLTDDEENISVWTGKTDDLSPNDARVFSPQDARRNDPAQTQLSFQGDGNFPQKSFHGRANDDFTTFEVSRPRGEKPLRKKNKKIAPLISGVLAIAVLSLLGLAAWRFLAPESKVENSNAAGNGHSPLFANAAPVKNPVSVATYLVNSDGRENLLNENHLFADDEQFRFGVKPETDGYLYVISRNNLDKAQLAYPKPNQVDNSVKKNIETAFPPDDGKFVFNKNSPSEMWAYFVVVASREDELAKRIRTALGGNQEKSLAIPEVGKLLNDLDRIAEDSAKPQEIKSDSTKKPGVVITKLQKK